MKLRAPVRNGSRLHAIRPNVDCLVSCRNQEFSQTRRQRVID
jgi:hypothetical protein